MGEGVRSIESLTGGGFGWRIGRNLALLSFSGAFDRGMTFVAFVVVARALGPEGFGVLAFAQSVSFYVVSVADLGVPTYLVREIGRDRARVREWVERGVAIRGRLALFAYLGVLPLIALLGATAEARVAIALFSLTVFPTALLLDWVFKGMQRMAWVAVAEIVRGSLLVTGVVLFVRSADHLLRVPVVAYAASAAAAAVLVTVCVRLYGVPRRAARVEYGLAVREGLPIGLSGFLINLYFPFGVLLMGLWRSTAETGEYAAAIRIAALLAGFGPVIGTVLLPVVVELLEGDARQLDAFLTGVFGLTAVALAPVSVLAALYAPQILRLVFGNGFDGAIVPVRILSGFVFTTYLNLVWGTGLLASGRQRQYLHGVLLGAVVSVVAGLALMPWLGGTGAAASTVTAGAVVLLAFLRSARAVAHVPPLRAIAWPVAASALMGAALYGLCVPFPLGVGLGPLTYLLVLAAGYAVTPGLRPALHRHFGWVRTPRGGPAARPASWR